jgi:hypothetical protein
VTEYLDTVKENDNYRVRLEYDDSGEKPYDEGAVPILSREFGRYSRRWEAVNDQADEYVSLLNALEERFEEDDIERFLKIFLGAYSVMFDSSENNRYIAFDTAAWREKVGITDEWANRPDFDRSKLAEGSLSEIISWANGDVYGFIVERADRFETRYYPNGSETPDIETGVTWRVVDSCWGFFGREYAEEAATEAFDSYAK